MREPLIVKKDANKYLFWVTFANISQEEKKYELNIRQGSWQDSKAWIDPYAHSPLYEKNITCKNIEDLNAKNFALWEEKIAEGYVDFYRRDLLC